MKKSVLKAFHHILYHITGCGENIRKPIFVLNPCFSQSQFYNQPYPATISEHLKCIRQSLKNANTVQPNIPSSHTCFTDFHNSKIFSKPNIPSLILSYLCLFTSSVPFFMFPSLLVRSCTRNFLMRSLATGSMWRGHSIFPLRIFS